MSQWHAGQRWNENNERRDGLRVQMGTDGWMILPGKAALPVTLCPCCDRHFMSGRAARAAADMMYPITEPSDGNEAA